MLAELPLDLLYHLPEHQLGIPYRAELNPVVLVHVFGAVGHMAQGHAGGHWRVEAGDGEAGAQTKHEVGLVQEVARHERARGRAGTQRKRVILGEGALAG